MKDSKLQTTLVRARMLKYTRRLIQLPIPTVPSNLYVILLQDFQVQDDRQLTSEWDILNKLLNGFPKVMSRGVHLDKNYIAMEFLGESLQTLTIKMGRLLSMKTILQIGIQLVANIKLLHDIGHSHMDIKLDNVMIGSCDYSKSESSMLYFIDMGASRKINKQDQSKADYFEGNLDFSSYGQMSLNVASKQDDIISILYLLMYLQKGKLPWQLGLSKLNRNMAFQTVKNNKKRFHQKLDLFYTQYEEDSQGDKSLFEELIQHIDSMLDNDEVDYQFYIQRMYDQILREGQTPDWKMDWTLKGSSWNESFQCNKEMFDQYLQGIYIPRKIKDQVELLNQLLDNPIDTIVSSGMNSKIPNILPICKRKLPEQLKSDGQLLEQNQKQKQDFLDSNLDSNHGLQFRQFKVQISDTPDLTWNQIKFSYSSSKFQSALKKATKNQYFSNNLEIIDEIVILSDQDQDQSLDENTIDQTNNYEFKVNDNFSQMRRK
ncbi:casein kinase [Stylonychia lemnae]|uniref:Casein kinase I n=1 Tax=Stylonychia lemnae TaxID=5949 RepID=A0A078AVL8_STYLE|nr:casein kinase [Stylonychia lemnae]|eukprot:CDW86116.1 casein kinase [Stylonychia lemnae]